MEKNTGHPVFYAANPATKKFCFYYVDTRSFGMGHRSKKT